MIEHEKRRAIDTQHREIFSDSFVIYFGVQFADLSAPLDYQSHLPHLAMSVRTC